MVDELANLVETECFVVDPETGEIVGLKNKEEWQPRNRRDVEWVLSLMQQLDSESHGLITRLEAIKDQIGAMIRDKERRRSFLDLRFAADLEEFAKLHLLDDKAKSYKTPYGTLRFRTTAGSIKVINTEAGIIWARTYAPTAIKVTESIVVTPLKGYEKDLPQDIFEVTEPHEKFSIDTGIKP